MELEMHQPYTGIQTTCVASKGQYVDRPIGYKNLSRNPPAVMDYIMNVGAASAAMWVGTPFYSYKNGIYPCSDYAGRVNHAVVIIGWGEDNGQKYWLIRNSWGTWGDSGHFKLARTDNFDNQSCGILSSVYVGNFV